MLNYFDGLVSDEVYANAGGSQSGNPMNVYYQTDNSKTINQTNNSPKALSRLEIYRQTHNALKA
jgi:hypothetical protein